MSKAAQKSAKPNDVTAPVRNGVRKRTAEAHDQILTLQRSLGNQGVGRLLQLNSNQAGVSIGSPSSQPEQEADRIATQGASPSANAEGVRKFSSTPQTNVSSSLGAGHPLPETLRDSLEPQFGYDLGQVRLHTGGVAAESAKSIDASAFTIGQNIVFGAGQYAPESSAGKRLIAHELTHVVQQNTGATSAHGGLPLIQRSPGPSANLDLPWTHGNTSLFEVTDKGIRVLVGVDTSIESNIRKIIPKITERVSKDNKLISDATARVAHVFIAPTTTRFALLNGEPVLMLDPGAANVETVAHEMGHAVFQALVTRGGSKAKDAAASKNLTQQIADIFDRLAKTKPVTMKGTFGKDETHPIGLWMVDPSQWMSGGTVEHPWDDPDEFFASAKEAFQINRAGLVASMKKATGIDSAVKDPAKELLAALDDFLGAGKLSASALSAKRLPAAEAALGRRTGISKVEDTLKSSPVLQWILMPKTRPVPEAAEPAVEAPTEAKKPLTHPNMVTGKGGVKDRLQKSFDERMREKILDSVNDLP